MSEPLIVLHLHIDCTPQQSPSGGGPTIAKPPEWVEKLIEKLLKENDRDNHGN